ncbi:MAG: hypothetical protein JKY13_02050 [Gammaproteobacteria bacterium]|nr:hypothetical protein [Gammaproteobacteria bacterium]
MTVIHAAIYKSVDQHRHITFSDQQQLSATIVHLHEPQIIPSNVKSIRQQPHITKQALRIKQKKITKIIVTITQPKNGTNIYRTANPIRIVATMQPGLQKGQTAVLYNGSKKIAALSGPQKNLQFITYELHPGKHALRIKIINLSQHMIAQSSPVHIHLYQLIKRVQ